LYGVAMVGAASVTFWLYVLAMSGLCLGEVARLARGKGFGPAGLAQMRRPDVVVIAAGLVVSVVAGVGLSVVGRGVAGGGAAVLADVSISTTAAVPVMMRMLGAVARRVLLTAITLATIGALLWAHAVVAAHAGAEFRPLVHLTLVLALGAVLVP